MFFGSPFSLFDIPIVAIITFAIVAPERFYQFSKFPPEHATRWIPRMRLIGFATFAVFILGRITMFLLLPEFRDSFYR